MTCKNVASAHDGIYMIKIKIPLKEKFEIVTSFLNLFAYAVIRLAKE